MKSLHDINSYYRAEIVHPTPYKRVLPNFILAMLYYENPKMFIHKVHKPSVAHPCTYTCEQCIACGAFSIIFSVYKTVSIGISIIYSVRSQLGIKSLNRSVLYSNNSKIAFFITLSTISHILFFSDILEHYVVFILDIKTT